ncbi:Rufy2 [Symbiodinium natans]|uniref:Rufy2 protein n=1 Tax=Symbiodinium natans TaxID=878477 RepID=A0A812GPZ2_9DINO|nr:Rufy2 [Symbiodinium natans]
MDTDQLDGLAALLAQGEEAHQLARRFGSVASSPPQLGPETSCSSCIEDFDVSTRDRWDDDAENCSICSAPLGRRRLRPRHHCRICGRCVCASCSPNLVLMPGSGRELQRACTPCMAVAPRFFRHVRVCSLACSALNRRDGSSFVLAPC